MTLKLKVDSKGRIVLPKGVRDELGDKLILEKRGKGFLILPGKGREFLDEFKAVMTSEPKRKGKPENWGSSKIKSTWK